MENMLWNNAAALYSIPEEYHAASQIDGANRGCGRTAIS